MLPKTEYYQHRNTVLSDARCMAGLAILLLVLTALSLALLLRF